MHMRGGGERLLKCMGFGGGGGEGKGGRGGDSEKHHSCTPGTYF